MFLSVAKKGDRFDFAILSRPKRLILSTIRLGLDFAMLENGVSGVGGTHNLTEFLVLGDRGSKEDPLAACQIKFWWV